MTPAHQRARAVVEQLTMEPTKGSFQADADEWAAKCKTTDELIALIENAIAAALEEEREAAATIADAIGQQYAENDKGVEFPIAETCAAVACAVNIAAAIRRGGEIDEKGT